MKNVKEEMSIEELNMLEVISSSELSNKLLEWFSENKKSGYKIKKVVEEIGMDREEKSDVVKVRSCLRSLKKNGCLGLKGNWWFYIGGVKDESSEEESVDEGEENE